MLNQLQDRLAAIAPAALTPEVLALAGLAAGVLVLVFGLAGLGRTPESIRRMQAGTAVAGRPRPDLVRDDDFDLGGLLKAFVPASQGERTRIARRMRKAGITRGSAVHLYYLARTVLGLGLPSAFVLASVVPAEYTAWLPPRFSPNGLDLLTIFQVATGLTVAGFYGPALWLQTKISNRRERIRLSLPNAMDLLQVAVEAGLGFDAALLRISREMVQAAPDLSQELMMLQLELQAGKDRDAAFLEMADRCDLDEMKTFVNVILQSNRFGTSISAALDTCADGLRQERELKAQQKANRLPVQMSAVMAACMMPALLMICLAPMVIRWLRMF